ncbi:cobalamin B12-binding domain-containing protein [Thalassiella azotivora]
MTGPDVAGARARFLDAVAAVDRARALDVVQELLDAGVPSHEVVTMLGDVQRQVGELWQCGRWNVAQEHAATAISEAALALVSSARRRAAVLTRDRPHGRVVVACADGEWHSMAARLLAESLTDLGWDVTYLGASVPPGHLTQFLHDVGPDALAVSCSVPGNLVALRDVIQQAQDAAVPVLVGGRALGEDDTRAFALGADGWAANPQDADRLLRTWRPRLGGLPWRAPDRSADAYRLLGRLPTVVDAAARRLEPLPGVADAAGTSGMDLRTDLAHLLRACASALLVGEDRLAADDLEWWSMVLLVRGVPQESIARVREEVVATLREHGLADVADLLA